MSGGPADAGGLEFQSGQPSHDDLVTSPPRTHCIGIDFRDHRDPLIGERTQCQKVDSDPSAHKCLRPAGAPNEATAGQQPEKQNHEDRQHGDAQAERERELLDDLLLTLPSRLQGPSGIARSVERSTDARPDQRDAAQVLPDLGHGFPEARSGVLHVLAELGELGDQAVDRRSEPHPADDERERDDVDENLPRSAGPVVGIEFHGLTITQKDPAPTNQRGSRA